MIRNKKQIFPEGDHLTFNLYWWRDGQGLQVSNVRNADMERMYKETGENKVLGPPSCFTVKRVSPSKFEVEVFPTQDQNLKGNFDE